MVDLNLTDGETAETNDPHVRLKLPEGSWTIQLVVETADRRRSEPVEFHVTIAPEPP